MTPLVKSLVSLTEEAAEYIWFDMGTLARYSIDWKTTQPNLPFERVAICGRDKSGDRFLVLCDHADDKTFLVAAWALLNTHYTKTPMFAAGVEFQYFTHARTNAQMCTTEGSRDFNELVKGIRSIIALAQEVKPLDWVFLDHFQTWISRGFDYDYIIPDEGDCYHLHYGDDVLCSSNSIDGLKEAAQQDYRRRVLSCLVNGDGE